MWFVMMLIVLLTNGLSAFGLKVLAAWGLPASLKFPYLTFWYSAGLLSIGGPALLKGIPVSRKELAWGAGLAILSMGGQVSMAAALDHGVPGHIVFPVSIGGSVLVVALAARLLFRERMNRMSTAGVVLGLAAVVLLSVS